jgi:ribosomal subunit interface protein
MIKKIEISGVRFIVDKDLQKYITNKVRKIERYVPKNSRQNIHVEVKLREEKAKDKKHCFCEIIIHLPGEDIAAVDTTMNMYAACDIVIAKIKSQLEKYRTDRHSYTASRTRQKVRHFLGKIRSR